MRRYFRFGDYLALLATILGISGLLLATSHSPGGPLPSIFGVYGQLTPGRDSVRITRRPNGKIGVAIKLYYASGHTCTLSRDGDWREDHVEMVAEGLDVNQPCKLSAFFERGYVLLKDDGLRCAPVYCGTRGKFDGVSLPKSGATANPK